MKKAKKTRTGRGVPTFLVSIWERSLVEQSDSAFNTMIGAGSPERSNNDELKQEETDGCVVNIAEFYPKTYYTELFTLPFKETHTM